MITLITSVEMSIDFSSGLCSDELAQQNIASMPPMSPNQNIKTDKGAGKSTIAGIFDFLLLGSRPHGQSLTLLCLQ